MNAVNRAENKCMKSASNRKQLVAGTTMKSSDRGDKEMKNDSIIYSRRKLWQQMEGGGEIGQSLPLQPRKLLYV